MSKDIVWNRVVHVEATMNEEQQIGLKLKPINVPFPRVTIITNVTNSILFQFCMFSWKNLVYPQELLNWVILDPEKTLENKFDDPRIRIITTKITKFNDAIKGVMDLEWTETGEAGAVPRSHCFMMMECGDIMFPDTLTIKHRALVLKKRDCVIPEVLAFYDPWLNTNLVHRYYRKIPMNGLYWKKGWWGGKSSDKMVGLPYIGNCISIGKFVQPSHVEQSSFTFFKNFAAEVKELIKKMVFLNTQFRDEDLPEEKN